MSKIRLSEDRFMNLLVTIVEEIERSKGYGIDEDIFLIINNDRELYKTLNYIIESLLKKMKKGVELDINVLSNSSVIQKFTKVIIDTYNKEYLNTEVNNHWKPNPQQRKALAYAVSEEIITSCKERL